METALTVVAIWFIIWAFTDKHPLPGDYEDPDQFYEDFADEKLEGTTMKEWPALKKYHVSHRAYILSEEWRELSLLTRKRDGYRCKQCGATSNLNVHHLHYNTLYHETLEDLVTVCQPCHKEIHQHHKEEPYLLLRQYRP